MSDVDTITYCANGCTRINRAKQREPIHADRGNLCRTCYQRLDEWLDAIPERYARVADYLLPTADLDKNPETKATKRANAPAPIRLAALDLLDQRRGRKWRGLVPADDRRGALGTLHANANLIRTQRNMRPEPHPHVMGEADLLRAHLEWLAGVSHINEIHDEIRTLHRQLGDAIGEYPPKPIGQCDLIVDDTECGGPIYPSHAGVRCIRCRATWGHATMQLLGLRLDLPA